MYGSPRRIAIASGCSTVATFVSATRTVSGASETDGAGSSPRDVHAVATSAMPTTSPAVARGRVLTRRCYGPGEVLLASGNPSAHEAVRREGSAVRTGL